MEDARYFILPKDEKKQIFIYKGISTIKKDILEPYVLGEEIINREKTTDKKSQDTQYLHENMRNIVAFAISPSKKNIALYGGGGYVFFLIQLLILKNIQELRLK